MLEQLQSTMGVQAFEGQGKTILDRDEKVMINPQLRYEFSTGNVGEPDEWIQTVHTTTVTNEHGRFPRGAISKQRSCVETSTVDPKFTCYDFELYDTTFFLRVSRDTIEQPDQASALGGSVTDPELAAAAYKDEMGPDILCYQQYGLRRDKEGTITVTEQYVLNCGDVRASLADGDLTFTEDKWSARVTYKMKDVADMEAEQDSDLKTIELLTNDMANLYAYTSYYDMHHGEFRTNNGTIALESDSPTPPEPEPIVASALATGALASIAVAAAALAF